MSIGLAGTTNGKANEIHTAFTTYQDELTWLSGISFVGPAFEHRDTVTGGLKNDCGDFVTGGGIAHYRTLRHRYRRWTPLSDSCQQHTDPLIRIVAHRSGIRCPEKSLFFWLQYRSVVQPVNSAPSILTLDKADGFALSSSHQKPGAAVEWKVIFRPSMTAFEVSSYAVRPEAVPVRENASST